MLAFNDINKMVIGAGYTTLIPVGTNSIHFPLIVTVGRAFGVGWVGGMLYHATHFSVCFSNSLINLHAANINLIEIHVNQFIDVV